MLWKRGDSIKQWDVKDLNFYTSDRLGERESLNKSHFNQKGRICIVFIIGVKKWNLSVIIDYTGRN